MRVYIICHSPIVTGGTELLHQFSYQLSQCGIENYMVYPYSDGINCPVPAPFMKYNVKYVSRYVDAPDAVLVVAETAVALVDYCKKGIGVIWWLSVNNYFFALSKQIEDDNYDVYNLKNRTNIIHLVQSYYAKMFVEQYFGVRQCYYLKDYINDEIVNRAKDNKDCVRKHDICVYNPKKGFEHLAPIIEACRKDIIWIPLEKMTPSEMADTMCKAKVYIDFGEHPGKDRIPREAAICDCCILTNRRGSAAYQQDVNIPFEYKIEDVSNRSAVLQCIYELVDNYDTHIDRFADYRNSIAQEKEEFKNDIMSIIVLLQAIVQKKLIKHTVHELEEHRPLLDFISTAAKKMDEYAKHAKDACSERDAFELSAQLLRVEYMTQLVRETIYAELGNIFD